MKKYTFLFFAAVFATAALHAQQAVEIGGAPMYPTKNIVQNASGSADHTTLVAALKAAGLSATLEGNGPFTLFAPTNAAFAKLPKGMLNSLMRPENKPALIGVLSFLVVPGKWDVASLEKLVSDGGGKAQLKTLQGNSLSLSLHNGKLLISGEKGDPAGILIRNAYQSNGLIHVVDAVLMPQ